MYRLTGKRWPVKVGLKCFALLRRLSATLNPSLIEAAPLVIRAGGDARSAKALAPRSLPNAVDVMQSCVGCLLIFAPNLVSACKILPGVATPSGCIYIRSTAFPRFRCGAPVGEVRHVIHDVQKKRVTDQGDLVGSTG